jgi:ATP-dependent helicase/nuclease subunit A
MTNKRNEQQDKAADPRSSAWASASAGTGKTHMLTNRVLRLLLNGAPPNRILCLTFTKAAAAEMANRINERLAAWASMSEAKLTEDLQDLALENIGAENLKRARQLFVHVLDAPGGLQISTIHAFCQSLMARFPLEAGIAPHFSVLDERTAAELRNEATIQLFDKAARQPNSALGQSVDFITTHIAEQTFTSLASTIMQGRQSFADLDDPAKLEPRLRRALHLPEAGSHDDLLSNACVDAHFDREGLEQAVSALSEGGASDQKRGAEIATWLSAPTNQREADFALYANAYLTKQLDPRKTLATKKVAADNPDQLTCLQAEAQRVQHILIILKLFEALHSSMVMAQFGATLVATYTQLKRQAGMMDYDDLIAKARNLVVGPDDKVGQRSAAEWVLFKLDGGIEHILVDEAQDTNSQQWKIIETLAYEFFHGLDSHGTTRTMFAVGDPKQSIYSFQGAEPAEFGRAQREFAHRIKIAGSEFQDAVLDLSYRSTEAVLKLVDTVFANPAARHGLTFGADSTAITHQANRANIAGLVEIWPPEAPDTQDDADANEESQDDAWALPTTQQFQEAPYVRLAERIAGQIRHWIDTKQELTARARPINAGDILILVRRRNDFFTAMVSALKNHHIDVAGMDRMILNDQLAVMDLIALGRFALMPEDDLNLAIVLKTPFIGLNDDHLITLAPGRDGSLWVALQRHAASDPDLTRALAVLRAWLARADFVAPYEFYSHLLDAEGGRMALVSRLGPDAEDPIDEFLGLTLEYERNHAPSLEGFLHWLEATETEVKREMEQAEGQVRVMTVHGAKGLQAPIVFLPDTRGLPTASPAFFWLGDEAEAVPAWPVNASFAIGPLEEAKADARDKQLQEHNRQLYVALTRAEDQLYICGYDTSREAPENCWYNFAAEAFDALRSAIDALDWDNNPIRRFEMGTNAETEKADQKAPTAATTPLPEWARTPPMAEPTPSRPLSPSMPETADVPVRSPLGADMKDRFLRGTLIHKLLEVLPEHPADQRPAIAGQILGQPSYELADQIIERWIAEVTAILDNPEYSAIFGENSLAEVPITGLAGDQPISGLVDRLVVEGERVLVIDYKTNRPPPKHADDIPPAYTQQMATYRNLLRQIYPDHQIDCALLWTDGPTLMPMSEKSLAKYDFVDTSA